MKTHPGYTGDPGRYEKVGIVHYAEGYVPCSCGELVWYKGHAGGMNYLHPYPLSAGEHWLVGIQESRMEVRFV